MDTAGRVASFARSVRGSLGRMMARMDGDGGVQVVVGVVAVVPGGGQWMNQVGLAGG